MNHCINSSTSSEPKPNPILAIAISLSYFCWRVAIGWRSNTIIRYFQLLLPTFNNWTSLDPRLWTRPFFWPLKWSMKRSSMTTRWTNNLYVWFTIYLVFVNPINSTFPNFMPSAPSIFRFDLVYSSFGFELGSEIWFEF